MSILFIGDRGSTDQVPQTALPRPVELPIHEGADASPSTAASCAHIIGDTTPKTSVGAAERDPLDGSAEGPSHSPDLFRSPLLPQAPANLFGRDAIIDDLLGLAERSASVMLFGSGGNGKSAIAHTLLHHDRIAARFGKHRYFMRCDDLVDSLDGLHGRLSDTIGASHQADMTQLYSYFAFSTPPCILVFDGVEFILDPLAPGASEIATAIEEIGRCQNVFLLATSRMNIKIPGFHHIEVPTLDEGDALDTFYTSCSLERSNAVDRLLAELDYHPLSTDLLASAVWENGWDEPGLLKAWHDRKTGILKGSGCQSLEENIRSIFRTPTIRQLGTAPQETLEAIALYPNGVKESKLESTFPRIAAIGEAANALCKFSLMYRQDGFITMLSPFRLYFLESTQLLIYHPGGDITQNSTPNEGIQYIRRSVVDTGVSFSFHQLRSCRVTLKGFSRHTCRTHAG